MLSPDRWGATGRSSRPWKRGNRLCVLMNVSRRVEVPSFAARSVRCESSAAILVALKPAQKLSQQIVQLSLLLTAENGDELRLRLNVFSRDLVD